MYRATLRAPKGLLELQTGFSSIKLTVNCSKNNCGILLIYIAEMESKTIFLYTNTFGRIRRKTVKFKIDDEIILLTLAGN